VRLFGFAIAYVYECVLSTVCKYTVVGFCQRFYALFIGSTKCDSGPL
jgi:hypothetical protein